MIDRLKIEVRTNDTIRTIIMNLGTFNYNTRSWKLEMTEEFVEKLMETFSSPEGQKTGVQIILETEQITLEKV